MIKKLLITCLLLLVFAGCSAMDARTLTTIFEGIGAISELDQASQQTRIAEALEKDQQVPDKEK